MNIVQYLEQDVYVSIIKDVRDIALYHSRKKREVSLVSRGRYFVISIIWVHLHMMAIGIQKMQYNSS